MCLLSRACLADITALCRVLNDYPVASDKASTLTWKERLEALVGHSRNVPVARLQELAKAVDPSLASRLAGARTDPSEHVMALLAAECGRLAPQAALLRHWVNTLLNIHSEDWRLMGDNAFVRLHDVADPRHFVDMASLAGRGDAGAEQAVYELFAHLCTLSLTNPELKTEMAGFIRRKLLRDVRTAARTFGGNVDADNVADEILVRFDRKGNVTRSFDDLLKVLARMEKPFGYLRTCAWHAAISDLRKQGRSEILRQIDDVALENPEFQDRRQRALLEGMDPALQAIINEYRRLKLKYVSTLDDPSRSVFILRDLWEWEFLEIAELLYTAECCAAQESADTKQGQAALKKLDARVRQIFCRANRNVTEHLTGEDV